MTSQLKTVVREALLDGQEVPATLANAHGLSLAQGLLRWKDAAMVPHRDGRAAQLRIDWKGTQLVAPLAEPLDVTKGKPVKIEFGPSWK